MASAITKAFFFIADAVIKVGMAAGVTGSTAQLIGFAIAGTTMLVAGKALLGYMTRKPDFGSMGQSLLSNSPSNTASLNVIYGARQVGGTRVFISCSDGFEQGTTNIAVDNGYLNQIIVLGEGPIEAVKAVYLNNIQAWPVMDNRFRGSDTSDNYVYIEPHLGATDQLASQELIDIGNTASQFNWTDKHTLSGVAYLYVRLRYDQEMWASGLPTITADVYGKKIDDPRQTINGVSGTSINRYSNNPALCIRDYLTNTVYGRGIDSSLVDDTSFIAAANYCEEDVTFNTTIDDVASTITQDRYTCNGVVTIGQSSIEVINQLLTACRGMLVFQGGKYRLIVDKAESASLTFNSNNIIGQYDITRGGKEFLANRIQAQFFNPGREWQTDYAFVEDDVYKSEDNSLLLQKTIELPFTADMAMAKYIALQNLRASRNNVTCSFKTTQEGLLAEVGDVINITLEDPSWVNKKFRVVQIGIENSDEVRIVATEYDSTVFSTSSTIKYQLPLPLQLPSFSTIAVPTGIGISETLFYSNPKIINRINISWTTSTTSFVTGYEIKYQKLNESTIAGTAKTSGAQYYLDNLKPGTYRISVRAVNSGGYTSKYTTKTFVVSGVNSLPSINPPGITSVTESLVSSTLGSGIKAKAVLSWTAIVNPQWTAIGVSIDNYEVEYKLTSASSYEGAGTAQGTYREFFDITPGIYNFRVRAVSDAGVKSSFAETTAEITGLSAAPSNVSNFSLRTDGVEAYLSWTPTTDLDVKVGGTYEIRHSVATSGATWQQSIKIGNAVAGSANSVTMPLLSGTYSIKAVDSTGNKSAAAVSIINTVSPNVFEKRNYATITDTTFAGTKENLIIDSGNGDLKFEADTLWDAVTGNIDTWGLIDTIGGLDLVGTYYFSNTIDLTAAGSATLSGGITFTTLATGDVWDLRDGNIDTWTAIDANSLFDDVNATLYVSVTNDDPASGSATWGAYQVFTIGNYYGRGFRFKMIATTGDTTHQINVSQLQVVAEVFYRNESETLTTATSGSSISYDTAFHAVPNIFITAQNLATGDYYTITSSAVGGFTLQFFNASGTGIARTAYYLARGY